MNMRWKGITPFLRVPWDGERGRRLLDTNHNFHQSRSSHPPPRDHTLDAGMVEAAGIAEQESVM